MKTLLLALILLVLELFPASSFAWSRHNRLTEIAIGSLSELKSQKIFVTDFSDVEKNSAYILQDLKTLKNLKYQDMDDYNPALTFNENIKINKNYLFRANYPSPNTSFQDIPGQTVSVADILIKYSDEPDWGMDQLLFNKDQYPQIWKSQYNYMGGSDSNDPIPTQAFRHMYWESWTPLHALESFKIPLSSGPMGQAPDRAALFMALSKRAKELHLSYWSVRFLANALHYLEDVSQPYHSTQTATKIFMTMPITDKLGEGVWEKLSDYVIQVQHIVTYYHFAFEDYMALLLEKYFTDPNSAPEAKELVDALSAHETSSQLISPPENIYSQVKKLSGIAVEQSSAAGKASLKFFPSIPEKFISFDGNASNRYMNSNYWNIVFKNGHDNAPGKQKYFDVVKTMYVPMGEEIRKTIKSALYQDSL